MLNRTTIKLLESIAFAPGTKRKRKSGMYIKGADMQWHPIAPTGGLGAEKFATGVSAGKKVAAVRTNTAKRAVGGSGAPSQQSKPQKGQSDFKATGSHTPGKTVGPVRDNQSKALGGTGKPAQQSTPGNSAGGLGKAKDAVASWHKAQMKGASAKQADLHKDALAYHHQGTALPAAKHERLAKLHAQAGLQLPNKDPGHFHWKAFTHHAQMSTKK